MNLNIKLARPEARVPTYATPGASAFDLHAATAGTLWVENPLEVDTGLCVEVPPGYVLLVNSRSGHGFNYGVTLANSQGWIDSDYRGSIKVKLTMAPGPHVLRVRVGDRIAQAMLVPAPRVTFNIVESLSDTERGTGGLGSTGV